jgi:hypothetical protein
MAREFVPGRFRCIEPDPIGFALSWARQYNGMN